MRIALVASLVSPLRPPQANGPHSVIVDLARGLASRGHTVNVYAAAGSGVDGLDVVEIPVDEAAAGAAIRVDGAPSADATAALNSGFERLFAHVRRSAPDVVSQHAFDGAAFDLADGLPTLHTLHLPPHRVGGWLVEPGDEAALVAAVPFARALDRQVIRRDAQRHLGIGRMVDAYEHALHDLAAPPVAVAS